MAEEAEVYDTKRLTVREWWMWMWERVNVRRTAQLRYPGWHNSASSARQGECILAWSPMGPPTLLPKHAKLMGVLSSAERASDRGPLAISSFSYRRPLALLWNSHHWCPLRPSASILHLFYKQADRLLPNWTDIACLRSYLSSAHLTPTPWPQ